MTLLGTRNTTPASFRAIVTAIESGHIDTSPWITHRLALEDVPARFAAVAAGPELFKAVIAVAAPSPIGSRSRVVSVYANPD